MRATQPLRSLLVAEPKFRGATHASFNAGLVAAGAAATVDGRVAFAAERDHREAVRAALVASESPALVQSVEWIDLDVGRANGPGRWRNVQVIRRVLSLARRGDFAATLLASTSGYQQLLALALLLRFSVAARPWLVVVHDNWSDFVDRAGAGPAARARQSVVRAVLRWSQPAALRLATLQSGLSDAAQAASRTRLPRLDTLPPPLLAPIAAPSVAARTAPRAPGSRRFALVGLAGKGPSDWFGAAASRTPAASFVLAGSARASDPLLANPRVDAPGRGQRLEFATYRATLADADFAVALLDPEIYRWRISASALDLLAVGVPGIFNRCAFVERLFAEHGRLGWICEDCDEFLALVARLSTAAELPEYAELSDNCLRAGAPQTPEAVGGRLRQLLSGTAEVQST